MKVCAQCGNKLGMMDRACKKCGCAEFTETKTNIFGGGTITSKGRNCIYCGASLEPKARFCWSCGKPCDGTISLSFLDEKKEEPAPAAPELDFLKSADDFSAGLGAPAKPAPGPKAPTFVSEQNMNNRPRTQEIESAPDNPMLAARRGVETVAAPAPQPAASPVPGPANVQISNVMPASNVSGVVNASAPVAPGAPVTPVAATAPAATLTPVQSAGAAANADSVVETVKIASTPAMLPLSGQSQEKANAATPGQPQPAISKEQAVKLSTVQVPVGLTREEAEKYAEEQKKRAAEAAAKAAEEQKRRQEEERKRHEEAEAARRIAEEKKREEEKQRRIEEEKKRQEEEQARKAAEMAAKAAEAARKAEEERKRAEEEAARKAEEERRRAEEEAARKAAEEKRKAEEEAKRKAAEEAAKKAAEEKKRAEEEAARKAAEEKKKAEEEAARKAAEEKKRAEEEARRKAEEEAKRKAAEEKKRAEEEAARKAAEAKRKADEEKRKAEEAKRKAEEEARKKAEEEAARKAAEERERKMKALHEDADTFAKKALKKSDPVIEQGRTELETALDKYHDYFNQSQVKAELSDSAEWYYTIVERLGIMYYNEHAFKLAEPLIKEAATHGKNRAVVYYVEWMLRNRKDIPTESGSLKTMLDAALADQNVASRRDEKIRAIYSMGRIFEEGITVEKNSAMAFKCYKQSAEMGDPKSMALVGQFYLYGDGIGKDPKAAFEWNRKAAELGQEKGLRNIAIAYDFGTGVKKDAQKAVACYKKLLEFVANDRFAMYRIAYCLADPDKEYETKPTEEMMKEACEYAKKAIEEGEKKAEFILGYYYTLSIDGGPDYNKAAGHFTKAANHGEEKAKKWLAKMIKKNSGTYSMR